jgi:putative phage-type endonuclease
MQVERMEQGSLPWHEHRAKYRNASEASIIMDCAPAYWKTSKRILWEQQQGLRGSNVDENNPAIMHGNNMEAAALACLNKQLGSNMKPAVFVEGKYSASLDGYGADAQGQLIKCEIKCPWKAETSQVWKMAADGEIAEYYRWQMIHQDYCAPTEQSFFFVYISDEKNILIPHLSPEEDTAALLAAWDEFSAEEPAPDWEDRTDDDMRILVERHRDLVQQKAMLDVELKLAEKALKAEAGDGNVIAFGAKIQTISRKGNIDYSSIPEIEGVNVEDYRKPGTSYQKIYYEKEVK